MALMLVSTNCVAMIMIGCCGNVKDGRENRAFFLESAYGVGIRTYTYEDIKIATLNNASVA